MGIRNTPYLKEMTMAFTGFTCWTISDAFKRYLNAYPIELIACLSACIAVILLCTLSQYLGGVRDTFMRPQLGLRIFRGAMFAGSTIFAFITFMTLDLTTGYALVFATPFVTKILSVIITGEKIKPRSWGITTLGFIGVLIVLRPGFIDISIGSIAALTLTLFLSLSH